MKPEEQDSLVTELVEDLFTYHAPVGDQAERYERLRISAKQFAYALLRDCPPGTDRIHALMAVRKAVMCGNASIATHNVMSEFVQQEIEAMHAWYAIERALKDGITRTIEEDA